LYGPLAGAGVCGCVEMEVIREARGVMPGGCLRLGGSRDFRGVVEKELCELALVVVRGRVWAARMCLRHRSRACMLRLLDDVRHLLGLALYGGLRVIDGTRFVRGVGVCVGLAVCVFGGLFPDGSTGW